MPTPSHRSARRRGMILGAALSSRRNKAAPAAGSAPAPAPVQKPSPDSDLAVQLTELKGLLDKGILTEAEFDAKKKQILGL